MASRFTPDRRGIAALAKTAEMRVFVGEVAEEAVGNIERNASPFLRHRAEFTTDVVTTSEGVEGRAQVESSFWHWDEFGSTRMPARAPIRNGVQQALNSRGGRLGRSR